MSTVGITPTIPLRTYAVREWCVAIESVPLPGLLSDEDTASDVLEIAGVRLAEDERALGASTAVDRERATLSAIMGVIAASADDAARAAKLVFVPSVGAALTELGERAAEALGAAAAAGYSDIVASISAELEPDEAE